MPPCPVMRVTMAPTLHSVSKGDTSFPQIVLNSQSPIQPDGPARQPHSAERSGPGACPSPLAQETVWAGLVPARRPWRKKQYGQALCLPVAPGARNSMGRPCACPSPRWHKKQYGAGLVPARRPWRKKQYGQALCLPVAPGARNSRGRPCACPPPQAQETVWAGPVPARRPWRKKQ